MRSSYHIPRWHKGWLRLGRWWVHFLHGRIPVIEGGGGITYTQFNARFRNDDGNETTASWVAAENADASLNVDTNYRIRLTIGDSGSGSSNSWVLRYSRNGGAYTAVSGSSNVVRASASPNLADNAATTQQLGTESGFSGFSAGVFDEADGSVTKTLDDEYTEFEYCFQIRSADVDNNDTIDFRVYRGTTALSTYTVTIRATVVESAGATPINVTDTTESLGVTDTATGQKNYRALASDNLEN